MAAEILSLISTSIQAGTAWFRQLVYSFEWWEWIVSAFVVCVTYRFLLAPIFGGHSAGSDAVRKVTPQEENKVEKIFIIRK